MRCIANTKVVVHRFIVVRWRVVYTANDRGVLEDVELFRGWAWKRDVAASEARHWLACTERLFLMGYDLVESARRRQAKPRKGYATWRRKAMLLRGIRSISRGFVWSVLRPFG